MDRFQQLIHDICDELGITMKIVSKGWIIILEKNDKTRFLAQTKFDLNNYVEATIMDDKYATFEVMKAKGVPVIEHEIVFSKDSQNEYKNKYQIVEEYFERHNREIVIKENKGYLGIGVYHVTEKKDISKILDEVFLKNYSLSICPFYDIKYEYRLIILKSECILMYGKRNAKVIGDGKSTLRSLLKKFNPTFFADKLKETKYDRVLSLNEEYEYSWKHNLSQGAVAFDVEDENLKEKLLQFVDKIKKIFDLQFCSVDIIETKGGDFLLMELNSGVAIDKYCNFIKNGQEVAKNVYRKAIQAMFQED